jgi:hypothetical protein
MGRRIAYLHLGLPGSGAGFLEIALPEHAAALEAFGVAHPVAGPDEMFRAAAARAAAHPRRSPRSRARVACSNG